MYKIALLVGLFVSLAGAALAQDAGDAELQKIKGEMLQLYSKGEYDKGLAIAERLVELTTQRYGKDSIATAKALRNRGVIEVMKGDDKSAGRTFDDAIDIFRKHKDLNKADGASFAETLDALGGITVKEDPVRAENLLKQAIEWSEKSNGPESMETTTPIVHLAEVLLWRREFKKSAEYYGRALDNLAKSSAANKGNVTLIYHQAKCAYKKAKMDDSVEALEKLYGAASATPVDAGIISRKPGVVSAGVVNGKALHLEKPRFPAEARAANADGAVEVEVLISERGTVISACSSDNKQHPALIQASEAAAYRAKFSPTTVEGNPVKVSGKLVFNFRQF